MRRAHSRAALKQAAAQPRAVQVVCALLLLLGGTLAPAQELPEALQPLFRNGVEALRSGRLEAAEEAFTGVLRRGGRAAFVYNNLGIVYQRRGEHEKAIAQFRQAVRLEPNYAAPRLLMGASLLALGKIAEAVSSLERSAQLQPREPLARAQLARAYERAGNWLAVVQQYRALRELQPDDPEYAYQLGTAYLKLSAWCFDEIRRKSPGSARLYQALGESYLAQGRPEFALRAFQRAAEADAALSEVHLAIAELQLRQGRLKEALIEAQGVLSKSPENAAALALKRRIEETAARQQK